MQSSHLRLRKHISSCVTKITGVEKRKFLSQSLSMTTLRTTFARSMAFATSMFLAGQAWANNGLFGPTPSIGSQQNIRSTAIDVIKKVLNFMALIAVIFIVIAGIRLVISQGEEGEKDKAKKTIIYVVVGLIVVLLAKVVVSWVTSSAVAPR